MVESFEFPQFVGPSYTYKSTPVDMQESVNLESVRIESPASPYKAMLIGTPGSRHLRFNVAGTVYDYLPSGGSFPIRGIYRCSRGFGGDPNPATVAVAGGKVYEIKTPVNGVCQATLIMNLPNSSSSQWFKSVDIVDAGGESGSNFPPKVVIADGIFFHVINMDSGESETLALETASCKPEKVALLDARVYAVGTDTENDLATNHVYWSDINDPGTWDPTSFISAAVINDPVVSVKTVGNYLWLIGTDTYEIWQTTTSSGTLYSPIRKVSGAANGVGTSSADSVATIADKIFFVGEGPTGHGRIYMGTGTSCSFISTDAMEDELCSYEDIKNCKAFCYSDSGRTYYVVSFITDDVTWVYNLENKCWHKRSTYSGDNEQHRWKFTCCAYNFGKVLVGSDSDSKIYELSTDIFDDDGDPIQRRRVCPHIMKEYSVSRHASFTLELECGNALASGQGSDPQVMLKAYDDFGRKPRAERWKSTGLSGNYRRRMKWNSLGEARDRVYEIRMSDPIRWSIYGAKLEIETSRGGR